LLCVSVTVELIFEDETLSLELGVCVVEESVTCLAVNFCRDCPRALNRKLPQRRSEILSISHRWLVMLEVTIYTLYGSYLLINVSSRGALRLGLSMMMRLWYFELSVDS
jgi:hypothetical protein